MRSKRAETMRPKRSEIWLVSLNPTLGAELQKTRPVVVVSADTLGVLPIKLIVPFTGWSERYSGKLWARQGRPNGQERAFQKQCRRCFADTLGFCRAVHK